ncbi:MAG TPA: DUF4132 domain-containing protein [Armatimonadota bacterium]|nr:DUF4132 domain-containing protein [Armatimonadota bacterium]
MLNQLTGRPNDMMLPHQSPYRLLEEALPILGPFTPLPAIFEELLRAKQGLSVHSSRLGDLVELQNALVADPAWPHNLADVLPDDSADMNIRILAAIIWAHANLPVPNTLCTISSNEAAVSVFAFATFFDPATTDWCLTTLEQWLKDQETHPLVSPPALPLLCFLKGLQEDALSYQLFSASVRAGLLHPTIASQHPLRYLNRLLDYVGLSTCGTVLEMYHRMVSECWPMATEKNWPEWQWVTVPGGPDLFPQALQAMESGDRSLRHLHELKYAPLPSTADLNTLLANVNPSLQLLVSWLHPECKTINSHLPGKDDARRWLRTNSKAATAIAYSSPSWWNDWCTQGMPIARETLRWLQAIPVPVASDERNAWLDHHYLPGYHTMCANLLLAQASAGQRLDDILTLAESENLPAIRALALMPTFDERALSLLRHLRHVGGKPAQQAAEAALGHLARRQGLPDADELERQHLLRVAWESGPFAGERVRVGWQEGYYRIRLSLHQGKIQLDVIGPLGITKRIPQELRQSDSYRQARAAQREAQAQYRLFKQHLERYLLDSHPISYGEFRYLLANPIFAHLAERLVWQTADGDSFLWAGEDRWETLEGRCLPLSTGGETLTVTLAHPIDLADAGELVPWQALAADRRLVQPIKQLFREIYTAGNDDCDYCHRFAGRRIDPVRAYALLRTAGYSPGAGVARREWPGGITAHLCWAKDAVSHDLFGPQRKAEVMTGDIWFTRDKTTVSLQQVNAIIFSETLRAADLLTTRAAVGDAELTSHETIVLRASLLREVARSYRLTNLAVQEEGQYAIVLGKRATYRVNLASGTVLLEPEGRQIMLPEHEERWHPAESYDTTTEVLATILTLVHDEQIADLTFIAQLSTHPAL